jgi:hypothetical protein
LLLHCDKVEWDIRNGNSSASLKDAAVKIHDIVKEMTGIFLKACSAHVWRVADSWAHRNKKAVFAGVKERARSIFKAFFKSILEDRQISFCIVRSSVLLALLEMEHFETAVMFTAAPSTQAHREQVEHNRESQLALKIHNFIEFETKKLHIHTLQEAQQKVRATSDQAHLILYDKIVAKQQLESSKVTGGNGGWTERKIR